MEKGEIMHQELLKKVPKTYLYGVAHIFDFFMDIFQFI